MLCLHETAASADVWLPLAEALGDRARTIAYDRRGWGRSPAPEPYGRTTIGEQAEDAAGVLAGRAAAPAVLCGAGLGAVAALDLTIRHPEVVLGAVLIEPPLLAFLPAATEALSAEGNLLREAVAAGGPEAGMDLYLSGRLPALGPGAGRLSPQALGASASRPLSLFAELAAVASWPLPVAEMPLVRSPSRVIVCASTPPLVRLAGSELAARLGAAELCELEVDGLPQAEAAGELAELALEVAGAA